MICCKSATLGAQTVFRQQEREFYRATCNLFQQPRSKLTAILEHCSKAAVTKLDDDYDDLEPSNLWEFKSYNPFEDVLGE